MIAPSVFYLLEDIDPSLDCRNLQLMALNPSVSFFLTQQNIPYQIPEDFYDEYTLRQEEEKYFFEQLDWFHQWDTFLKNEIRYCGQNQIDLARDNYLLIKYFVDSVIIQAKILHAIVKKMASNSDASIVYVRSKSKIRKIKTFRSFREHGRDPLWGEMLPAVCSDYGVPYAFKDVEARPQSAPAPAFHTNPKNRALLDNIKVLAKDVQQFFHYQKASSLLPGRETAEEPVAVFFSHTGSPHLDPLVQNLIRNNNPVYTCRNGETVCLNPFLPHLRTERLDNTSQEELTDLEFDCGQAAKKLGEGDEALLPWISERCGFPVRDLVLPYFQDFIANKCFLILKRVCDLRRFYLKKSIQFVLSHTSSDIDSKCALIAARLTPGIKTVGIQHGCDVFNDRAWHIHDLDSFDYYFASDGLSEEKFRRASQLDYFDCAQIFLSSHYLKKAIPRNRKKNNISNQKVKKILYIPTRLSGHVRYFNCLVYPTLWFFEYQKGLIEYFLNQPQLQVTYKHVVTFDGFGSDSIIPFIQGKRPSNIRVVTGRVVESLQDMDAVLMDRPTTAFFEVIASGLPVLAIYPDFIRALMDTEAIQYFGKSLQPFSNVHDAIHKIEAFLKSDLSEYRQTVPLNDISFAETLFQIQQSLVPRPEKKVHLFS